MSRRRRHCSCRTPALLILLAVVARLEANPIFNTLRSESSVALGTYSSAGDYSGWSAEGASLKATPSSGGANHNRHSPRTASRTVRNLCYCKASQSADPAVCEYADICIKHENAACFHSVRQVYSAASRSLQLEHTYGCAPLEAGSGASHLTCNAWRSTHAAPSSIACCYEGNLCNRNVTPPLFQLTESISDGGDDDVPVALDFKWLMPLVFLLLGCLIGAAIFLAAFVTLRRCGRNEKIPRWMKTLKKESLSTADDSLLAKAPPAAHQQQLARPCSGAADEFTSGSGSGGVVLNQRTIALDLTMLEHIARGRYGEVRKALYRGSLVAVKTFYTTEEESWRNERDIYQTQMLNHENILQYVAADISSNIDSITQMMLITDYHPLGSLYDYLRRGEPLSLGEALSLVLSTATGLEHLHNAVRGTGSRRKPQIAHRDLKSKNIIVKRPGVCCIADFGLALRCESGQAVAERVNVQVGTKRYMAPEVLSRQLNVRCFDAFKAADMYSFALVLWEILQQVQLDDGACSAPERDHHRLVSYSSSSGIGTGSGSERGGSSGAGQVFRGGRPMPMPAASTAAVTAPHRPTLAFLHAQSEYAAATAPDEHPLYRLPYQDLVDSDPSFEQMRRVVVERRLRPELHEKWCGADANPVMRSLCELMRECWSENARSRHTSLKVKKDVIKLMAGGGGERLDT